MGKVRTEELLPTAHVDPKKVEYFQKGGVGSDEAVGYFTGPDGQKYVVDGNHRVMAKLANGDEYTEAEEIDLPEDTKKSWFKRALGI